MTISINNKDITLKYSFRGFIIYEQIANDTFSPKGLKEIIILFYSMVMASDKDLTITFDDFINYIDDHPETLTDFSEWLNANINKSKSLSYDSEDTGSKEKSEKK